MTRGDFKNRSSLDDDGTPFPDRCLLFGKIFGMPREATFMLTLQVALDLVLLNFGSHIVADRRHPKVTEHQQSHQFVNYMQSSPREPRRPPREVVVAKSGTVQAE